MKVTLGLILVGAVVLLLMNLRCNETEIKKGAEEVTVKRGEETVTVTETEKKGVVDLREKKEVREVVKDSVGNVLGELLIEVSDTLLRYDFMVKSRLSQRVDSVYITRVDTLVIETEWYETFEFGLAVGAAISLVLVLILE